MRDDEILIKQKIELFKKLNSKIHIMKTSRAFLNGYIDKFDDINNYIVINDDLKGPEIVLIDEIYTVQQYKSKEEMKYDIK